MVAHYQPGVLHRVALAAGMVLVILSSGCSTGAPLSLPSTAPTPRPPVEDAEPTAAAAFFFASVRKVDVTLQNRSIAYWRVETDTTPTAGAALAAIEFMGRKYRDQGRAMVLRIDVGPDESRSRGPSHYPSVNLIWNPTTKYADSGLIPPGKVAPHTLTLFVFRGFDVTHEPSTSSDVTTESLTVESPGHSRLLQQARDVAGLR